MMAGGGLTLNAACDGVVCRDATNPLSLARVVACLSCGFCRTAHRLTATPGMFFPFLFCVFRSQVQAAQGHTERRRVKAFLIAFALTRLACMAHLAPPEKKKPAFVPSFPV